MWLVATVVMVVIVNSAGAAHPCDSLSGSRDTWLQRASSVQVVVVGGGAAGLSAAKVLKENGIDDFLLLEAQNYLGGRIRTYRQGSILVEDGAEWINGGSDNRLYNLAQSLGALTQPLADSAYDWRAKTWNGQTADARGWDAANLIYAKCETDNILKKYYNVGYGQCYLDNFDKAYTDTKANPMEKTAWRHYLHMWVNKDTGNNNWLDQSARDADNFTDWGKDEWNQWASGYDTLINHLKGKVTVSKIKTSTPVCKIFWQDVPGSKVLLVTQAGTAYLANQVIFTASVGHLKERHQQIFSPSLPASYQTTLNGTKLGVANKVQIGWASSWWGAKPLDLNIIFPTFQLPGNKSWLYGMMEMLSVHQQKALLQGFITGDSALTMESLPDNTVKQHLVDHLKAVTGQNVPTPTFFRRSKWWDNVWTRGSYNSFITVEGNRAGLHNREPFSIPLQDKGKKPVLSQTTNEWE